jgi:hypothetical protein
MVANTGQAITIKEITPEISQHAVAGRRHLKGNFSLTGRFAMEHLHGSVVYTDLLRSTIYRDGMISEKRLFKSLADAQTFYEGPAYAGFEDPTRKDTGWMVPIPIVEMDISESVAFAGFRLRQRLRFGDADTEHRKTWQQEFDTTWNDLAVDQVPIVMAELEKVGAIPSASDAFGVFPKSNASSDKAGTSQESNQTPGDDSDT